MSSDLHYLSLDEVARRLKARKLSSVEATRAILDRIDRLDPKLKSYATVTPERALRGRRAPRRRDRGRQVARPAAWRADRGEGSVQHRGRADRRRHGDPPPARARPRTRPWWRGSRQAGAVILGKLQMTEGAYGAASSRRSTPPVNPWNAAYWTGVVVVGLGRGDRGRPLLRLAGLRHRRVDPLSLDHERPDRPQADLGPGQPRRRLSARRVARPYRADVPQRARLRRSMLGVIAGADPDDPTAAPRPVPDYAGSIGAGVKGKKLGVPKNLVGMDADAQRAFDGAAATLKSAGATLVDVALPATSTRRRCAGCRCAASRRRWRTRRPSRRGAPTTVRSSPP